jgi:hydroxymethylglutaryl-CoA lyase
MERETPPLKLVECPSDAMQGLAFIPTEKKVAYLNALLRVGFDTIDFGSFVSPKAVPQMGDTAEVVGRLHTAGSASALLAIVANTRGARQAVAHETIRYAGYPFSVSPTFQLRNTHQTISASFGIVKQIQDICAEAGREAVVYISMGFGNPYGDPYDEETVLRWAEKIRGTGVRIISLADTAGVARPGGIAALFSRLAAALPDVELGAHFHSAPHNWEEKIAAAWDNGCRRFDSAIGGIGGCPFAGDKLVGNIATENLLHFFREKKLDLPLDHRAFHEAQKMASGLFG